MMVVVMMMLFFRWWNLLVFLRELRPEDLNGSAAVFRVKEEMMARMTATLGANMVRDVLIQDLVQQ